MQKKQMPDFTYDRVFKDDGSLEFRCHYNKDIWPWQALHPHDPIYLQTINFWTSFEAGTARGEFTTEKWTALTETNWEFGTSNIGRPFRGVAAPVDEKNIGFDISLYDEAHKLVYRLSGKGVIFQNRDFDAWRQAAKDKIATLPKPQIFEYTAHEKTGAPTPVQSFLSDLTGEKAQALVTHQNGFMPHHPYLSGSGDHVNATHLHVLGEQFAVMMENGRKITAHSGSMRFNRYVELGHPIDIELNNKQDDYIDLSFYQAGKLCAAMAFKYKFT